MPITLDGSGTISGLSTGGLPDGSITTADIANGAITTDKLASATAVQIQPISASVAANALTITLGPCALAFRSTTLGSGTSTVVQNSGTLSLTISSGSTLGTVNAVASRIVVLAINNAGTMELAAVNISGGNQLDETNLISTTAEGGAGAADSANVIYSTTARTSVAYRVVGFVDSTQATAGTWATAPSTVQGIGGQALAALSSLGYGQTWQSVTGSRAVGTTYYNTTGKPICIGVVAANNGGTTSLTIGGVTVGSATTVNGYSNNEQLSGVIPPGATYVVSAAFSSWAELR